MDKKDKVVYRLYEDIEFNESVKNFLNSELQKPKYRKEYLAEIGYDLSQFSNNKEFYLMESIFLETGMDLVINELNFNRLKN